jgi:signal transduction histidine kinase
MVRQFLDRVRGRPVGNALLAALAAWLVVAATGAGRPVAAVLVSVLVLVALALGRRWPVPALVAAFVGLFSVDLVQGGRALEDPMLAVVVGACFLVGRWARLALQPWAAAGVLLLLSLNVVDPGGGVSVGDVAFPVFFTAGPWLLGLAVQLSTHRADRATGYAAELTETRHEEIRRATDEERLRIAHELHDIVAHHLSGVSLQAQVARRRVEAGGAVSSAELAALEETARAALADLRRLLGVLRPVDGEAETAPQESLADLEDLLERSRRAGQDVHLDVDGSPRALPPAPSLVVYRVLQEALTNARRHGGHGPTTVQLCWLNGVLEVRVSNPYAGHEMAAAGHGRLGMAERARLFGGTVTTTTDGGRWTVVVRLPTPDPVPEVLR